ncbi:hypothetical protein [Streptomyces acidicola]|uniref:hypothetical protein n=1 Tax=Streptomyces acidicola TaxID=2596892 RepID=UPI00382A06EE
MGLPKVTVRHHAALSGEQDEKLVTAAIGPTGDAIALWAPANDLPALRSVTRPPGGTAFPDPGSPYPVSTRVTTYSPKPMTSTRIPGLGLANVSVQPLPDGRVLIVGARAAWRTGGPDRNAVVYDDAGRPEAEETFGDGINHVHTTESGRIWVGYFDEGVFGNYGWDEDAAPPPVGVSGLVRFSPDLEPEWHFPRGHPWGPIYDCYALNVDGETAWTCYYDGFSLVRVHDSAVDGWFNDDVNGASALAVGGDRVALFGGYSPRRDRLVVGRLESGRLWVEGEFRVVLPDGGPLPSNRTVVGRGADLHLLSGHQWFRLGLDDLA